MPKTNLNHSDFNINDHHNTTTTTTSNSTFPATTQSQQQYEALLLTASSCRGGRTKFPAKLRQILDDSEIEGNQSIVSWLPHGKAFKVHRPKEFATKIVGRYFNHGQYRSFTRQLYHYGFTTVDFGLEMGAFYHPQFLRDAPFLQNLIGRKAVVTSTKKEKTTTETQQQQLLDSETTGVSSRATKNDSSKCSPSMVGSGMIESQFQTIEVKNNKNDGLIVREQSDSSMSDSTNDLFKQQQQKRPTEQHGVNNRFETGTDLFGVQELLPSAEFARLDSTSYEENGKEDEEEMGVFGTLLFGNDDALDEGTSTELSLLGVSSSPASQQPQPQQREWFSSIGDFFQENTFDNDIFGDDLEPRPIEEMSLLPYTNLSPNESNLR